MVFSEKVQELTAVPEASHRLAVARATWNEYRFPIVSFILARILLSLVAAIVANSTFVAGEVSLYTYNRPELSSWQEALLGTWQHWDGLWYLKIASSGYEIADFSPAFYPLYPLLIRLLGYATQSPLLDAAISISTTAFFVALLFLWKLLEMDFGDEIRRKVILYTILFPTSYYFFAVYTESLFLAFVVSSFYFARKGNWVAAGILGMLATLTRNTGLALAIPFAFEYMIQKGFSLRRFRFDFLSIGLIPLGILLFMAYSWFALEDPLAFAAAQVHWGRAFAAPWNTLSSGWEKALGENLPFMKEPSSHPFGLILYLSDQLNGHVYNLAFTVVGLILVIAALRFLPIVYSSYAALGIAVPLFMPSDDNPLFSMPRFLLVLFPLLIALALLVGRRTLLHRIILVGSGVMLLVFSIRYFAWYWVA